MTRDIWTPLWASEIDLADLPVGAIVAFTKAPMRAGEYGLADALIAGLDRIPLTHVGIVTATRPSPELVHSTLAGLRRETLSHAAKPHRHAPIFLFRHASASHDTLRAAAKEALRRTVTQPGEAPSYPSHDLLVAAILLRTRNGERFDEHTHRRLAALFAAMLTTHSEGRMCAAFLAEVFDSIGAPLIAPDERTAHDRGFIEVYESSWVLPPWTIEYVSVALAGLATHLVSAIDEISTGPIASTAALLPILRHLADNRATADSLARWLLAPVISMPDNHPTVQELINVVESSDAPANASSRLPPRFTTVNDLLRSPDLMSLGHCIDWWSPNADTPAFE